MRAGRAAVGGLAAALLLALAACGEEEPTSDSSDDRTATTSAETSEATESTPTSATDRPTASSGTSTATAAPDDEPTRITSYVAEFTLDEDGTLTAAETLSVHFLSDGLYGIVRYFDRQDAEAPGGERIAEDIRVTADGEPAHVAHTVDDGRYDVYTIGNPRLSLPIGVHVYEIGYTYDDVLEEGDLVDAPLQLHWDLVPSGWAAEIESTDLTVELPAPAQEVACTVGEGSASYPCPSVDIDDETTVRVETGPLPSETAVTLLVGQDLSAG